MADPGVVLGRAVFEAADAMTAALVDFRGAVKSACLEMDECAHLLKLKAYIPFLQQPDILHR